MAYRTSGDTSNPWLPPSTQTHVGRRLGANYQNQTFPLPYGTNADFAAAQGLSGFYQKASFPLPYGQYSQSRRRSCCRSRWSVGNPTPAKTAGDMSQSIHSPALLPVIEMSPPQDNTSGLAVGIAIGVALVLGAGALAKGGL